jgi:hypothetical protein
MGFFYNRHCEPTGRTNVRPMTSSAKQSMATKRKNGLLRFARNDAERTANNYAATTSSLITTNFFNSIRPKLVVSATSAASRPVPIRMRPIRG